jgi:hypothetical protein
MDSGVDIMAFMVGVYKDTKKETYSVPSCDYCHNSFKDNDAIMIQYDVTNLKSAYVHMHMTCFINQLRQSCPDFWKEYVVGLI